MSAQNLNREKPDLTSLRNTGFQMLNLSAVAAEPVAGRCIAILGAARGGTSAVAAALAALGVNMGPGAQPPVFEDLELALAIEQGRDAEAREIMSLRAESAQAWGFKRPGYVRFARDYHSHLGAVRYVAVFRDPLATAMRAQLSSQSRLLETMTAVIAEYADVQRFLEEHDAPALMVSYEKLLENPELFVSVLAEFAGLDTTEEIRLRARDCIAASPPDYVDNTRTNKSRGRLDIVEARRVRGWAQYLSHRQQAEVAILVNEQEILRVTADRHRQDLLDMGISSDGCCAFDVQLPQALRKGDVVRAVVTGDPVDIMNSPQTFAAPAGRSLLGRLFASGRRQG